MKTPPLNMSTQMIVKRAREMNLPVIIIDAPHNIIQIGYGIFGKKIKSTKTPLSNPATINIADNKELTNHLLHLAGLPVPQGKTVTSLPPSLSKRKKIVPALVVKPASGTAHGHGVTADIRDVKTLHAAFQKAKKYGDRVLIEPFLTGEEYRFIIIGYTVIAITKRVPAHVIGDGKKTIRQLVEKTNHDPKRGGMFGSILTKISIDAEARRILKGQGHRETSIPAEGATVFLTNKSNIGLGGIPVDVTDEVPAFFKDLALQAAHVIGLPVAGIDMIIPSLSQRQANLLEVNGVPGIYPQLFPVQGKPRDTVGALLQNLFPHPEKIIIPIFKGGKKITDPKKIEQWYTSHPKKVMIKTAAKEITLKNPRTTLLGFLINESVTKIFL